MPGKLMERDGAEGKENLMKWEEKRNLVKWEKRNLMSGKKKGTG